MKLPQQHTQAPAGDQSGEVDVNAMQTPSQKGEATFSLFTVEDMQTSPQNLTLAFGEIVALLCRSPLYRYMNLGDLEWLVLPPLLTNQVMLVHETVRDPLGLSVLKGLAMWAHVSVEVDKKLEVQKQAHTPFRLEVGDWMSGDIPWLLVVAPKEAGVAMVKQLEDSVFKGQTLKRFSTTMFTGVNARSLNIGD